MNYRDDRDALRGRIEGLEQDLEQARRAQETEEAKRARIHQVEARMRETEENLRVMQAELEALGAAPPQKQQKLANKSAGPLIVAMVTLFFAAVSAAFFVARKPAHSNAPVNPSPTFTPAFTSAPIPEIPADDPLKPPAATRQVKAQWDGKITRMQSFGGVPGSPCVVTAMLENHEGDGRVAELSVFCNGKPIYQSTDQLSGVSSTGYAIGEGPGKSAGTFAYVLNYSDIGARSGPRTQVSIDTTHGQGVVWSDIVPVFRVEFSVNKQSDSVKGEALLPTKKNDPFEPR